MAGVNVRTYPGAPEYLQDLASKRIDAKFGEALNAALEKIKADGRFAKLSEKWFGLDVSQPPK